MDITCEHIEKICKFIDYFYKSNNYYPVVVAAPKLIEEFLLTCTLGDYPGQGDLEQYKSILDRYHYGRDKTYKNALMLLQLNDSIKYYRIYDLPRKEKKKVETNATGSVFKHINFNVQL